MLRQDQPFRCPACGHSSSSSAPVFVPQSSGLAACPSCGLTDEEGQRKLNEELANLFNRGMQLSPWSGSAATPQTSTGGADASIISSATVAALGSGGYGGAGAAVAPTATAASVPVSPTTQTYNISQHYHHSTHLSPTARREGLPAADVRTGAEVGAIGDMARAQSSDGRIEASSMEMDANPASEPVLRSSENQAEPYMRSGYEYLAQRDYNLQLQAQAHTQAQMPSPATYAHATDPAFTSKEWWRDFHPVEFQYGMFQQMREREMEAPGDDERMVL